MKKQFVRQRILKAPPIDFFFPSEWMIERAVKWLQRRGFRQWLDNFYHRSDSAWGVPEAIWDKFVARLEELQAPAGRCRFCGLLNSRHHQCANTERFRLGGELRRELRELGPQPPYDSAKFIGWELRREAALIRYWRRWNRASCAVVKKPKGRKQAATLFRALKLKGELCS